MILSRKGVYDNGLFNETSIISAYKEAGYETWYVSYLSKSHIGDNEINLIANEADHYVVSTTPDCYTTNSSKFFLPNQEVWIPF